MQVFNNIEELKGLRVNTITWGSFDGIHRGHWEILFAMRRRGSHLVVVFEPSPKKLFSQKPFYCLTLQDEKVKLMRTFGVDNLLVLPFTPTLARLGPDEFIDHILRDIKAEEIIVGENHTFGQGQKGSARSLASIVKKMGIKTTVLPLLKREGMNISSSRIRKSIYLGTISTANRLLGRRYSIKEKVVEGKGRGRKIGRPTANLNIPDGKVIPMDGVYIGRARFGKKKYDSLISLGAKPTFNNDRTFEVHILDTNQQITGRLLEVYFVQFIRRHIPFKNLTELKTAIDRDEKIARKLLKNRYIL